MAKKVNKNQRTDRHLNRQDRKMAKIVVATKNKNGNFSFNAKVVELDKVQDEISASRN